MSPYAVEFRAEPQYLEARVAGDFVDTSHALKQWVEARARLTYLAVPRLLIVRGPGCLAPPESLSELVIAIPDVFSYDFRAAMVAEDPAWCAVINHVASARRIPYRAFVERTDAIRYLLG